MRGARQFDTNTLYHRGPQRVAQRATEEMQTNSSYLSVVLCEFSVFSVVKKGMHFTTEVTKSCTEGHRENTEKFKRSLSVNPPCSLWLIT